MEKKKGVRKDNNSRDYELSSDFVEEKNGIRRIKVTKLPDGAVEETLINYFENVQRNGGGAIECIEYHPETSSAIITFQEAEAVDRVLRKRPLLFLNKQISVEKVETDEEEEQPCHTIEVHGFPENTGEDVLEMYFENTKRSGGGDVTSVVIEDGVALVTFTDEKVASSVCERQHTLGGRKLKVSLHLPKKKSYAVEREETEGSVCNMKEQGEMLKSIPQYFASEAREVRICHDTGILCYDTLSSSIPVGQFIAPKPLTKENPKCSITILAPGDIREISLGLVPQDYPPNKQPGWNSCAIGYHADDGGIFIEAGSSTQDVETCDVGDIMEVEIDVDNKKVWFRKNGNEMIQLSINFSKLGLYPCVGFHSKGEAVRLNEKEVWMAENKTDLTKIPPDFPTFKYGNLWISPGKRMDLTKLGRSYSGWLILHNPKSDPVGYRVTVGKNVKIGQLNHQEPYLGFIEISNINEAEQIHEAIVEWVSLRLGRQYKREDLDNALNQTHGKFKHILNVGLVDTSRGVSDGMPKQKRK